MALNFDASILETVNSFALWLQNIPLPNKCRRILFNCENIILKEIIIN